MITALYADGGLILSNPSPHGGTWAWCYTVGDARMKLESGVITPAQLGRPDVTNNDTEFMAAINGLLALPRGWAGNVYLDSEFTVARLFHGDTLYGLPLWLQRRGLQAIKHVDIQRCRPVHVAGHPTLKELRAGRTADGVLVSRHNDACDKACRRAAQGWLDAQRLAAL